MKDLYNIIEGMGHIQNRLGSGSSGTIYDLGNGKVRKIMRVKQGAARHNDNIAIERWAKVKKGLKVIPYIYDVDYDGYTMDKFETPCKEGDMIAKAIDCCLFTTKSSEWKESRIDKLNKMFGEDDAQWIMQWLKDFEQDYELIMGANSKHSDDIRSANIGKDKKGNIVCFDWFDPYCY